MPSFCLNFSLQSLALSMSPKSVINKIYCLSGILPQCFSMLEFFLSQSGPAINLRVTFFVAEPTCDGADDWCRWFVLLLALALASICLSSTAQILVVVTRVLVVAAARVIALLIAGYWLFLLFFIAMMQSSLTSSGKFYNVFSISDAIGLIVPGLLC